MNTPHSTPSALPGGRRPGAALTQPQALDGSPLVMRGFDAGHDLQGLCQLFSDVFGQPMAQEQWRWKYMQAPGSQHYHALAAHAHTGQLLGHMGVIIVPGVCGGQAIRMAHATDLMVSPLARTG
ncbi:GNAT family N-acetyltransferase, partial [Stenotrophomonas sp. YIM B06876]|uniref:GNAT family N-acetyltransferase n=1 Tax=Stenotrophomonas sp. YIM B06876 TaxID=3060211 RepID=UPI0027389A50